MVRARRPGREHAATAPTWQGGRGRRVPDAGVPTWSLCGGGAVGGGCCWVISSPGPGCKAPSMPGASTVTQLGSGPGGAEPLCRPSVRGEEPQVPHSSGCDQGDVPFPQGCLVLTGPSQGGLLVWFYQSTAVAVPQPGGLKPQLLVALQLEARGRDAGAVGRFLPRPLSLWCRRPPPPCVPTVVPLCPSVSPSLLMRTPVTWD